MHVLITGGSGFIASHIVTQLLAEGHEVTCCVRDTSYTERIFQNVTVIPCDFTKDIAMEVWLKRLENVDIVINCAGILYHPQKEIIWSIHYHTPKALFDACLSLGIKKIIQISALGIDRLEVDYAKSKQAADEYLLSLPIAAVVLRPSLVYGRGSYGGSSLFRGLAALPMVIPIIGGGEQQLQPIHVEDLARTVAALIHSPLDQSKILCAVGPQKISFRELLSQLRAWLGLPPAKMLNIPLWIIKLGSRLGDLIPFSSLNSTSFKMLLQNNIVDHQEQEKFQKQVPFKLKRFTEGLFSHPSYVQDRWHAKLFFLKPLLRVSLAFIWIFTAICTVFLYPKISSYHLLAKVGVLGIWQPILMYGAAILDAALGIALLFNYKLAKIILIQLLLLFVYSVLIAWKLPELWIDPMGPVAKNIPIMAATLICWALESKR